jgi:hypothetical protein
MDGSGERDRDVAGTATCSTQSRCTVKTRQGEVCQRLDRRFRMRQDVARGAGPIPHAQPRDAIGVWTCRAEDIGADRLP